MNPTKYSVPYSINLNSGEFKETINHIIETYPDIEEVIETGTFNGMGSTKVFAQTGKYVFTIECNENNYRQAVSNLRDNENVCVFHGLSMQREALIKDLINENFRIYEKYTMDSKYPKAFYMREVCQSVVQDDLLNLLCSNERRQLIFLDSAGGVGYCEFLYLMGFSRNELDTKILVLDDCNHIKHKRSVMMLLKWGYVVNLSSDNRFAWCDLLTYNTISKDIAEQKAVEWMQLK